MGGRVRRAGKRKSKNGPPAKDRSRPAGSDPADEQRKPVVGRIPDPWRAFDARVRSRPIDGLEIHGAGSGCRRRKAGRHFCEITLQAIAAIDLCVVPTLTFDRLFAFLVLGHGRRQLLWFEVTRHPTAEWLARQITEAFPWTSAPAYLVRDNDGAYGHVFTSRVRAMGIRDRPISPGSPWQNGYAERLIGTLRRECLDRMLIFGESHLRRVLASYTAYYNQARTHLALQKDAPLHRAVQRSGVIVAIPILAGLHHQYVRI